MGDEERISERLSNLTTAQTVTNDRLDQIDETLDALDRTIRGDYEKDTDGLVARFHVIEQSISKLNAVIFQSAEGKKGALATIDALVSGRMDAVDRRKNKVAVIIATITTAGMIFSNLDRLGDLWIKVFGKNKPDQLETMIDRAKHPHVKHLRPRRVIDYSEPVSPPE